jgi:hypothetical protein
MSVNGTDIDQVFNIPKNPLGVDFYQVGVYCESLDVISEFMADSALDFGADEWVIDMAVHYGELLGHEPHQWEPIYITAHMAFNYQMIPGIEFELMYWEGKPGSLLRHPYAGYGDAQVVCLTYKVEDTFAEENRLRREFDLRPSYRFMSQTHLNPAIAGKARYRDTMYDTMDRFGFDIRFSQKLPGEPYFVVPMGGGLELNPHYWGHDIPGAHKREDGQWYMDRWK